MDAIIENNNTINNNDNVKKVIPPTPEEEAYQHHLNSYIDNFSWFFGRVVGIIVFAALLVGSLFVAPLYPPLTILSFFTSTVLAVGVATLSDRGSYLDSFTAAITYWSLLLMVNTLAPVLIYGLASQALLSPALFNTLITNMDLIVMATPIVTFGLTAIASLFKKDALIDFNNAFVTFLFNCVSWPLTVAGVLVGKVAGMVTYNPPAELSNANDTEATTQKNKNSTDTAKIFKQIDRSPVLKTTISESNEEQIDESKIPENTFASATIVAEETVIQEEVIIENEQLISPSKLKSG